MMRRWRRGTGPSPAGRSLVAVQVGQFAVAGLLALVVVGIGTAIAARRVGEREAITEARSTATARAEGLVAPALTEGILTSEPAALAAVDRVVELGVLDTSLVRVKIWAPSGTILYSDEARLIGTTYVLGDDEESALRTGAIVAEVSDLAKPENTFERSFNRLLEVYLPIYTPGDQPVLFEAYFRYDAVERSGSQLWRSFAPIALGSLLLLELIQLPLAWSLATRLRDRQREREVLLQRALVASEVERRRIASDLHDGVVQDLAGVAYSLSAAARGPEVDPERAELLEGSAEAVREGIKALRSLLVELYPPNLEQEGLESAVADLLAGAAARGLITRLDTAALVDDVPSAVAQLLYRAAQEALRNVLRHAEAHRVIVTLIARDGRASVAVADDGRGFDPAEARAAAAEGHVGLKGLEALVHADGGTMSIDSTPARGTTVTVEVPIP